MRPMIIATSRTGFRLVDLDTVKIKTSKAKVLDIPYNNMVGAMAKGMQIENAILNNGAIVGTQGDLSNYPSVEYGGPCIVLSCIDNHTGYQIITSKGDIMKASRDKVVAFAEQYGLANGKVSMSNGEKYIEPLMGTFNELHLTASRVGNNKGIDVNIKIQGHRDRVNSNANANVSVEIRDADVFKCMTPVQREVLKQYYVWYTTRLYRQMANSMRLEVSASKVEKLGYLRGEYEWKFSGITDAYLEGRYTAKCSLGHSLRYEYHAKCDEIGHEILFGETCASDFFKIDKEDMKKLVKARKIMSDELTLISYAMTNNKQEELKSCVSLFYEVIYRIGTPQKLIEIFGKNIGTNIANFVNNNIPVVESLALLANEKIKEMGVKEFMKALYGKDVYSETLNGVGYRQKRIIEKYFEFMFTNRIEGFYSYDPFNIGHKRRDVGNYNKDARNERRSLIRYFKTNLGLDGFKFLYSENPEDKEAYPEGKCIYDDRLSSIDSIIKYNRARGMFAEKIKNTIKDCISKYEKEAGSTLPYGYDEHSFISRKLSDVCCPAVHKLMCESSDSFGYYYGKYVTSDEMNELLEKGPEEHCKKIVEAYNFIIDKEVEKKRLTLERERMEQERREQERLERERKERERLEKAAEEEKIRREVEAKAIGEALEKLDTLESIADNVANGKENTDVDKLTEVYAVLLKKNKKDALFEEYSVKIVMDMGKRGLTYDKCSENQKQMVNVARSLVLGEKHKEVIGEFRSLKDKIESALGKEDTGYKICCNINEKVETDDDMSVKQIWRIKDTIKRYKESVGE